MSQEWYDISSTSSTTKATGYVYKEYKSDLLEEDNDEVVATTRMNITNLWGMQGHYNSMIVPLILFGERTGFRRGKTSQYGLIADLVKTGIDRQALFTIASGVELSETSSANTVGIGVVGIFPSRDADYTEETDSLGAQSMYSSSSAPRLYFRLKTGSGTNYLTGNIGNTSTTTKTLYKVYEPFKETLESLGYSFDGSGTAVTVADIIRALQMNCIIGWDAVELIPKDENFEEFLNTYTGRESSTALGRPFKCCGVRTSTYYDNNVLKIDHTHLNPVDFGRYITGLWSTNGIYEDDLGGIAITVYQTTSLSSDFYTDSFQMLGGGYVTIRIDKKNYRGYLCALGDSFQTFMDSCIIGGKFDNNSLANTITTSQTNLEYQFTKSANVWLPVLYVQGYHHEVGRIYDEYHPDDDIPLINGVLASTWKGIYSSVSPVNQSTYAGISISSNSNKPLYIASTNLGYVIRTYEEELCSIIFVVSENSDQSVAKDVSDENFALTITKDNIRTLYSLYGANFKAFMDTVGVVLDHWASPVFLE